MRYAVLADIHGNLEALTAVLSALNAERIDRYLYAGDVVGYGADPAACLSRLSDLGAVIVAGNHDQACIGKLSVEWFNPFAKQALLWTRDQLSFTDLDRLRRLPLTATEGSCTLVHGTLRHPQRFEYLMDAAQAVETLAACPTPICLIGHTHVPCFIEYDLATRRLTRRITASAELSEVALDDHGDTRRCLINPGSVGQPRDGDARASCAVIDTDTRRVRWLRVPYDIAAAQRKIRDAGLPEFLAHRLEAGY